MILQKRASFMGCSVTPKFRTVAIINAVQIVIPAALGTPTKVKYSQSCSFGPYCLFDDGDDDDIYLSKFDFLSNFMIFEDVWDSKFVHGVH